MDTHLSTRTHPNRLLAYLLSKQCLLGSPLLTPTLHQSIKPTLWDTVKPRYSEQFQRHTADFHENYSARCSVCAALHKSKQWKLTSSSLQRYHKYVDGDKKWRRMTNSKEKKTTTNYTILTITKIIFACKGFFPLVRTFLDNVIFV